MSSTAADEGLGPEKSIPAVCCNRLNARACPIRHDAVDALSKSAAPPGSRSRSIGIHTYITEVLCGGMAFSARVRGASRESALKLGRQIDHAFTNRINRKTHSKTPAYAGRVRKIIGELSRRGIHTVAAQVAVGMAHRGIRIRTELDAIGCLLDGSPVVIEIKTTAAKRADYAAAYHVECRNRPRLLVGGPNTLHTRHMLQLGFGALCVNATRGVVVISCADGVLSYPLETRFVDRSLFEHKYDVSWVIKKDPTIEPMAQWPAQDAALMASVLKLKGFEDAAGWTKSPAPPASLRLRGHEPHQDLVVCVSPGRSSNSKRKNALAAARAAGCVHACILTHSSTRWKSVLLA